MIMRFFTSTLTILFFAASLMIGGCSYHSYQDSPEKTTGTRGPLHYEGPEINKPDLTPPEDIPAGEDEGEEVTEGRENGEADDDPGPGYYSILDWLPFERDLWGRSFEGDDPEEEDGDEDAGGDDTYNGDPAEPYISPDPGEGYSL